MKNRYHFFNLFTLLLYVICYIDFVRCYDRQHIKPSNSEILIYEYNGNQYEGYATYQEFTQCQFTNSYTFRNLIGAPIIDSNIPIIMPLDNIIILGYKMEPSDNNNSSFYISITDDVNSITTNFTITFTCKSINEDNLKLSLVNNRVQQLDNGVSFFYIEISGLEYTIYNLIDFLDFGFEVSNKSVQVVSKDLYLVSFGDYLLDNFDINLLVKFSSTQFTLQLKAAYDPTKYQLIQDRSYPTNLTSYGGFLRSLSPLIVFNSNLTTDPVYLVSDTAAIGNSVPKLIGQVEINNITYNQYIMPLFNYAGESFYTFNLNYNNGNEKNIKLYSVTSTGGDPIYQVPSGQLTTDGSDFRLIFDSTSYQYSGSPFKYTFYSFELVTEFPFGFYSNTPNIFTFIADLPGKPSSINGGDKFGIVEYPWGSVSTEYPNPNAQNANTIEPKITFFEAIPIIGFKYLLRIQIATNNIISRICVLEGSSIRNFGYETLAGGSSGEFYYEFMVNDISTLKYLQVIDVYNNKLTINEFETIYQDSDKISILLESPVIKSDVDIYNVSFYINDMDVLDKPCYNIIYFNSTLLPKSYPLEFRLLDPVSFSYSSLQDNPAPIPIRWSQSLQLFYCNFIVPKNTIIGVIPFEIMTPYVNIHSSMFSSNITLRVTRSKLDNDGPVITSMENLNNIDGRIGWVFRIEDQINGFSNGYAKVVGSIDFTTFKINFINQGLSIYNSTFEIILEIPQPCFAQDYNIEYIYLEDTNKRYSVFSKFDSKIQPENNPFRYIMDRLSKDILKTSTLNCSPTFDDTTGPVYKNININNLYPNVASSNRKIVIEFDAEDKESVIMLIQKPTVYIMASNYELIQCSTEITSSSVYIPEEFSGSTVSYKSSCELPVGFGYPDTLSVSIYGAVNSEGFYSGYSEPNLYRLSPFYSTLEPLLLSYEPYYYYSNEYITIYGKMLSGTYGADIRFSDGTSRSYNRSFVSTTYDTVLFIIKEKDIVVNGPFEVTVYSTENNINYTNIITIYPIYFNTSESYSYVPSPVVTTTPLPTNKPQQCLGTPTCGGQDHGYCVDNQGCVCYSPWIGKDCLSKVIIIPQPSINNTTPTTEIPITDDDNISSDEIDNIFYKSLISLVSLRELDINNKEVDRFTFEEWIFNQVNPSTTQYFTNVSVTDNSNGIKTKQLVNITATIVWFKDQAFVEFANQNLTMNPSSIKYTIEITNYPFKSKLNRLQLVMSASIVSNKTNDICSAKEFGDTTTGDNSNYLQIQIENKSLYGRFIKRGIINNSSTIVTLENELLDSQMNSISSPNQIQSYIGITIPWYEGISIIDPDFSVLVNPNSASSSSNSICTTKSSKLSTVKIIGIVIGCFAFVCIVIVSVVYTIYKKRQQKKFMKSVNHKLKAFS